MDNWFGYQYISLHSPIGEMTGFKCRLLLSAVPVHYLKKKKNSVEEYRTLRGIDTLNLHPFPCIITSVSTCSRSPEEMSFIKEFTLL